jgi:hypothetical protein
LRFLLLGYTSGLSPHTKASAVRTTFIPGAPVAHPWVTEQFNATVFGVDFTSCESALQNVVWRIAVTMELQWFYASKRALLTCRATCRATFHATFHAILISGGQPAIFCRVAGRHVTVICGRLARKKIKNLGFIFPQRKRIRNYSGTWHVSC